MYKGLKPVYWCPDCNTALAEAEIEYSNDPCYSIYVKLTVQMRELGANLVLAVNMNDFARKRGHIIDMELMQELLGFPVVEINAKNAGGFDKLLTTVERVAANPKDTSEKLSYGNDIKGHLMDLQELIEKDSDLLDVPSIWTAVKLLERDTIVIDKVKDSSNGSRIMAEVDKVSRHLYDVYNESPEEVIANSRYAFIDGLVAEAVDKPDVEMETTSDKIDKIVTNRILAPFIFVIIMFTMFQLTFTIGTPFELLIQSFFSILTHAISSYMPHGILTSLICNGIIAGVGVVVGFLPMIVLMFLFLSILEDCGYLARAAFTLDMVMHKVVGLHGKAFIPMILGFGCGVPAIMATRTMENEGDRILAMMLVPFMSCTSRLPIYIIFIGAFFSQHQGVVLLGIYLLGIAVALIVAAILKRTMFKGLSSPFVMELPTYKVPSLKGILLHTWEKVKDFLKKAGTIILLCSVILWALQNIFPWGGTNPKMSLLGIIGSFFAPIFAPLGFGTWQAAVAIIAGLASKEVVVATFGTLAGMDSNDHARITNLIHDTFTPLSALSFMAFTLLYTPCIAAIGTIKQETNSYKWPLIMCAITLISAYVVSFLIFQIGTLMGFG